ncbi:hypothetical protein OHC33_010627 [Knufia fluminis]|uniref:Uncharacterized protein n=1 Tax=Knufia fluminis TaxID=191047 RepID=A0AAN8I179_9EURO|nr:hypothetical protein OHC33_010627 [Knufia fluminis]
MKFTTILAAALPVFAAASALPGGQGEQGGEKPEGMGQWGGGQGAGAGQGPPAGQCPPPGAQADHEHGQGHQQREIEARAAEYDYMMEECKEYYTGCEQVVVVPKGQQKGVCIESLFPTETMGVMHLLDIQTICTYFEKPGCGGDSRGPWNNQDKEYSFDAYEDGFFKWHPKSYSCEIAKFGSVRAPVDELF